MDDGQQKSTVKNSHTLVVTLAVTLAVILVVDTLDVVLVLTGPSPRCLDTCIETVKQIR
jgi:hypothetical protein